MESFIVHEDDIDMKMFVDTFSSLPHLHVYDATSMDQESMIISMKKINDLEEPSEH